MTTSIHDRTTPKAGNQTIGEKLDNLTSWCGQPRDDTKTVDTASGLPRSPQTPEHGMKVIQTASMSPAQASPAARGRAGRDGLLSRCEEFLYVANPTLRAEL